MAIVPTVRVDGVELYYERAGSGETVVFLGDIGFGAWQWSFQVDALAGPYETVVWDYRGVGQSEQSNAACDIERMASDLEAVLRAADVRRAHLVGAGLGGVVALQYLSDYNRGRSLTAFGTTHDGSRIDEPAARQLYARPDDTAQSDDVEACRASLEAGFSPTFLDANPDTVEQICEWRREEDGDERTVERQLAAATEFRADPLYEYTEPALVCHGLADPIVPVEAGRTLAEELPRGTFEAVEGRHLCFAEHARAVNDRVIAFLDGVEAGEV
ncbi:alpha/beta fold hydrolase [Halovenus marina]|uniref:alpha/beta fold hydrolase n=1 Tax=Halovenus marina TaxID=3396621 RepID=UPI003F5584DF